MVLSGKYTTGFVKSKDGVKIYYRKIGSGDGVVLVHGAMMYSENFTRLAEFLSRNFTVYIIDRCGRGLSEMHENYSLLAEAQDVNALVNKSGAKNIFGLSSGAVIVLQTALLNPKLKKVAVYEPPFLDGREENHRKMVENYNRAIEKQNFGKAFISLVKGTGDKGSLIRLLPGFITIPFFNKKISHRKFLIFFFTKKENRVINSEAKDEGGRVSFKSLVSMVRYDFKSVNQGKGLIKKVKNLKSQVLLLGGAKSQSYLRNSLDKLKSELPESKKVIFSGVGHIAAHNEGKPEIVAKELKKFFLDD